jgi:hypothetical protein
LQALANWFNDPLVQSVFISPLIGAILGVLFAGLSSPPPLRAPVSVQQTVVIFKQSIVVKNAPGSSDEAWGYLIALLIGVVGITWGYSRYAHEILAYWAGGLFSCSAFILSAGLASAIRRQYNSPEWVWYIFAPVIAVGFSFYLLHLARQGILQGAREAARTHSFIDFYFHVLKEEHRIWLFLQIVGVLLGIVATLTATLRSVHYLALMNQRANGGLSAVWHFLARATSFSARTGGVVVLVFAAGISYLVLSGNAYELLQNRR